MSSPHYSRHISAIQNENFAKPLVSVILASFNGEVHIQEQIESILSQTYKNLELIVVDDCSEDRTLEILYSYAELDKRIKIYPSAQNLGLIANFERGLKLAKGEFVALSDQDDVFKQDKIDVLVETFQNNAESEMVVSDVALINDQGDLIADSLWQYHNSRPMSGKPFKRLVIGNFATGCAMMFRKTLLDKALPFPPDIQVHDWWLALVASANCSGGIAIVKQALVNYRQHDANVIGARPITNICKTLKALFVDFMVLKGKTIYMQQECVAGIKRIDGYLTRRDLWNVSENKFLTKAKSIYMDISDDEYKSIYARILSLPSRVMLFWRLKKIRTCLQVIFVTLFGADTKS